MSRPWRSSASVDTLKARAGLLAGIRAFFASAGVMEVDTPALSQTANTDPQIDSVSAGSGWLHSSPEFGMKRLLAAGSGDIYQLSHVFREGEAGRLHNPEFMLLEWYRVGWDHHQLMDEVIALIDDLSGPERALPAVRRVAYGELIEQVSGLDAHRASAAALAGWACGQDGGLQSMALDRDGWLDLIFSLHVQPRLDGLVLVTDYPASQPALARIEPGEPALAARFELFWDGVELANGYHELTDAAEQSARLEKDNCKRRATGKPGMPVDVALIEALEQGLPDCAGVALGIDRLLMKLLAAESIAEVMPFPVDRA